MVEWFNRIVLFQFDCRNNTRLVLEVKFHLKLVLKDYFNAKKRELSSQLENGGDTKKQCEEPTIVDDVFKEGLQNPDCLAILLICLCNLEIQLNSFLKESAEFKESRIQGDKQLQKLNASITLLRENFDDYERERKEKDQIMENLQKSKINMKN